MREINIGKGSDMYIKLKRDNVRNIITEICKENCKDLSYAGLFIAVYGEKLSHLIIINMCPTDFFDIAEHIYCCKGRRKLSRLLESTLQNEPWA